MSKVRVMYDFQAEASNELTTYAGETLTVIDPSAFDGWLKIRNSRGEEGIVPSSYVEYIDDETDHDIPPPPSHNPSFNNNSSWDSQPSYVNQYSQETSLFDPLNNEINNDINLGTNENIAQPTAKNNDPFDLSFFETTTTTNTSNFSAIETSFVPSLPTSLPIDRNSLVDMNFSSAFSNPPSSGYNGASSYNMPSASAATSGLSSYKPPAAAASRSNDRDSDSDDFDDDDVPPNNSAQRNNNSTFNSTLNNSTSTGTLTKHKDKNSYGLNTFLLFGAVKNVPESDRFSTIILHEHRTSLWKRRSPPYQISIVKYHNDKKYHGVKKFISYEIQTEKFPQRVRRRYNQFDWLHKRLEEKYPNICIPPLPDKAAVGNFEEEFIMKRKGQLELWLNRLSSHPVISESEVFIHFLQCDDTSAKWKAGKRKAEKDEYRGAQWFCTLTVPGESVDTTTAIKEKIEKFSKASIHLDNSTKAVCYALDKIGSFHSSAYKKEVINLGKRFEEFGTSLAADPLEAPNNQALSRAMVTAGNTYSQIGNLYGEQNREDVSPLLDRLMLYRGIIQQMPDIVQFEKNSIQTYEEFNQRPEKLQGRSLHEIAPRREIISHVTFAEINQFNRDKVDDLTNYMRNFLQKQIDFYTEITTCLKRAQSSFEQIPVAKQPMPSSSSNLSKPVKK